MDNENNLKQVDLGLTESTELAALKPLMSAVRESVESINKLNNTFDEFVDPKIKDEREAIAKAKKDAAALKNAEYQAKFREKQAAEKAKERLELIARAELAEQRLREVQESPSNLVNPDFLAELDEMKRKLAQSEAIAESNAAEASELAAALVKVSDDVGQAAEKLLLEERAVAEKRINDLEEALKAVKSENKATAERKPWVMWLASVLFFGAGWLGRGVIS